MYRLDYSLCNLEVFVQVGNFQQGLQFVAYEGSLCFWQPAMLFCQVGTSVIWSNKIVADLA